MLLVLVLLLLLIVVVVVVVVRLIQILLITIGWITRGWMYADSERGARQEAVQATATRSANGGRIMCRRRLSLS